MLLSRVADAIRQPVVAPDRDVRDFQSVLIDLGARLKLPGMTAADGSPLYPGGYADYLVHHQRSPGVGPLAGWRGSDGASHGRGAVNPAQLDAYIANQCFWRQELEPGQRYYKFANQGYLDFAVHMGFITKTAPIVMQLYSEPLQEFRLAAQGHGVKQPPASMRERMAAAFDPLPIWYAPYEERAVDGRAFPLHALTQRPMIMYHSWGSQNAWLRQILGCNKLYVAAAKARELGLADDDWVRVVSRNGVVKAQIKTMDGVNPDTVWTWNAVGKRAGAWRLDAAAPEARKGFLLNHLISEFLPDEAERRLNADPITGQAAWFDLRVRIEPCEPGEEVSEPQFPALSPLVGLDPPPNASRSRRR